MIGYHAGYHFWITPLRDKLGKSIGWRGRILFPSPAPRPQRLGCIETAKLPCCRVIFLSSPSCAFARQYQAMSRCIDCRCAVLTAGRHLSVFAPSLDVIAGQTAIAVWFVAFSLVALMLGRHASGRTLMVVEQCAMASVAVGLPLAVCLPSSAYVVKFAVMLALSLCMFVVGVARAAAMSVVRFNCGSAGLRRRCISVHADGDRQIGA